MSTKDGMGPEEIAACEAEQEEAEFYRDLTVNEAAKILGKKGGEATSKRKKLTSAENGKKGGRPKVSKPAVSQGEIKA